MNFQIKHRFTGKVLFEKDCDSMKLCVEAAVGSHANLCGAYLGGANLCGAYLRGANLCGANLGGAYLRGANFRDAYLRGAYLRGANLCGAYLGGANFRDAYLRGAYLCGAYLRGANLCGAYLGGANLCDADLCDANLCGASIGEGAPCTVPPVIIGGLRWDVTIADSHMRIGCELHSFDAWQKFSNRRILEMEGKPAAEFWKMWKKPLLAMCREHEKRAAMRNWKISGGF